MTPRRTEASRGPYPVGFYAIVPATVLLSVGFGVVAPVLPDFVREYDLQASTAALLLTSFAFGRTLTTFPAGWLADRVPFRRLAMVCSVVVIAAASVSASEPGYGVLIVAQAVQGSASSVFLIAAYAFLIRDARPETTGTTLATMQGSTLAVYAFSPLVGGFAGRVFGITGPFLVAAVCGGLALVIVYRGLPQLEASVLSVEGRDAQPISGKLKSIIRTRPFVIAIVLSFGVAWGSAAIRNTLVPLHAAEHLSLDSVAIGWLLLAAGLANFVTLLPSGRAMDRFGRRPLATWGVTLTAVASGLLVFAGSTPVLVMLIVIVGLARGLTNSVPVAVIADIVPRRLRGTAVGAVRLGADLGLTVGPVTAGFLADGGGTTFAFAVSAGVLGLVAVATWGLPETLRFHSGSPSPQE